MIYIVYNSAVSALYRTNMRAVSSTNNNWTFNTINYNTWLGNIFDSWKIDDTIDLSQIKQTIEIIKILLDVNNNYVLLWYVGIGGVTTYWF